MKHRPIDDPQVLAFIEKTEASYPADANVATVEQNRRYYNDMCAVFRQARPASVAVEDAIIQTVPVRHYTPQDFRADRPAILYVHGGGFVVGGLDSHDDVCAEIAEATGVRVTSVDYRLAPEHRYPAQIDDVETVWRDLSKTTPHLIAVGDSAGGNLCAALSLRMRRLNGPMPIAQVLIYPGLGGDLSLTSYDENAEAPLLRTSDILAYHQHLPVDETLSTRQREEISPLQTESFAGLPPSWIFTGDVDPLRDDGAHYVARLTAAGVKAEWRNHAQLVHGYLRGRVMSRRIKTAFDEICAAISEAAQA